jgi:ELWxxDGT repeat protein
MAMKTFCLCISVLFTIISSAQNPLNIKTVGGSVLEPKNKNQEIWQNNEWNGKFFYQGTGSPLKLCVTDGTTAGTVFIKEINADLFQYTIPAQNFIYIITERISGTHPNLLNNVEIWKSDGTSDGTVLVKALPAFNPFSSSLYVRWTSDKMLKRNFSVVGDVMYFVGYDATNGSELWKTDGTEAGTHIVKDIRPGTAGSNANSFCALGNDIYFFASAVNLEPKLWKTDGTDAGTVQVAVPDPFTPYPYVGRLGNKMIFFASNTANGAEPWVSDGTPGGTYMLADINPGSDGSIPSTEQNLHLRFNDKYCFFIANKTSGVKSLWRTDGTVAGTIQLTPDELITEDNFSGGGYSDINNNILYWLGGNQKLYRSNGTLNGTTRVTTTLYNALYLKIYKDAAWFHARNSDNVSNAEPYRSDGTAANTVRFDVQPGETSSHPYGFFVKNNKLYFFTNSSAGRNLYEYNGDMTFNGTVAGGKWNERANWNSMLTPGITDTAYIPSGFTVAIEGAKAFAATLIMNSGSSLNLVAATDSLFIQNELQGTAAAGNGVLVLKNFNSDTTKVSSAFIGSNMNIQGYASAMANITVSGSMNLTNSARLFANNNNVVLSGTSSTITADANNYVVTNGTGSLAIEGIGLGGRTGTVAFPIGTTSNFNPVELHNNGTADVFLAKVESGISQAYTGDAQNGTPYTSSAVNATWYINEGTTGGSNATIGLQWNEAQELTGFHRAQSRLGHYTGGAWQLGSAGSANGSNPYTWNGSGYTSFSPFGVLSTNVILPIHQVNLRVVKTAAGNRCLWTVDGTEIESIVLERSMDGRSFYPIYNSVASSSHYDDVYPAAGKVYYRLKAQDISRLTKYSQLVWLEANATVDFLLYPTIFSNGFVVLNNSNAKAWLMLYNSKGALVFQQSIQAGSNTINAYRLMKQGYFYQIRNNKRILAAGSLIKQ